MTQNVKDFLVGSCGTFIFTTLLFAVKAIFGTYSIMDRHLRDDLFLAIVLGVISFLFGFLLLFFCKKHHFLALFVILFNSLLIFFFFGQKFYTSTIIFVASAAFIGLLFHLIVARYHGLANFLKRYATHIKKRLRHYTRPNGNTDFRRIVALVLFALMTFMLVGGTYILFVVYYLRDTSLVDLTNALNVFFGTVSAFVIIYFANNVKYYYFPAALFCVFITYLCMLLFKSVDYSLLVGDFMMYLSIFFFMYKDKDIKPAIKSALIVALAIFVALLAVYFSEDEISKRMTRENAVLLFNIRFLSSYSLLFIVSTMGLFFARGCRFIFAIIIIAAFVSYGMYAVHMFYAMILLSAVLLDYNQKRFSFKRPRKYILGAKK